MLKWLQQIKGAIIPYANNNYRPFILNGRFLSYLALILFLLKFITIFHLIFIPQTSYFSNITSGLLVKMTNEERQRIGVSPLKINPKLTRAAEMKARDMISNNYFDHWSPQGRSPWYWIQLSGYDYSHAGENLAMGFLDTREVHQAWLNSHSHRQNIINSNYQEIGIAVVEGNQSGMNTFFVVQMFASPKETYVALPSYSDINTQEVVEETVNEQIFQEIESEEDITEEEIIESDLAEESIIDTYILGEYDTGVYIYPSGFIEIDARTLNTFQFLLLEYDDFIQKIMTIILLFLGFVLIINVFIRFDVQHPDLIFKGLAFLVLFLIFDYFDQSTIIELFFQEPIIK